MTFAEAYYLIMGNDEMEYIYTISKYKYDIYMQALSMKNHSSK